MRFFEGGKHVWLATTLTGGLLARKRKTKIAEIAQTNHQSIHRTRDRQKTTAVTTTAQTRAVNMALSLPRHPPRLPRLLRRSASRQPTIRAETPTRANQVPFAPATDRATSVRYTRPVRRRHSQGHLLWFRNMLEFLSFSLHAAQHKLIILRAHGLLRLMLTIFTAQYRRWASTLRA